MDKMAGILVKLIEKSRDGKIAWRDTASKQKFLTMLGGMGVAIDFNRDVEVYELQILDKRGRLIDSISSGYMPFAVTRQAPERAADMRDLHELARRSALNIDATLDELARHIDSIV